MKRALLFIIAFSASISASLAQPPAAHKDGYKFKDPQGIIRVYQLDPGPPRSEETTDVEEHHTKKYYKRMDKAAVKAAKVLAKKGDTLGVKATAEKKGMVSEKSVPTPQAEAVRSRESVETGNGVKNVDGTKVIVTKTQVETRIKGDDSVMVTTTETGPKAAIVTREPKKSEDWRVWNENLWFYPGEEVSIDGTKYMSLYIPWNWEEIEKNPPVWTGSGKLVGPDDYNTWLLVEKTKYDAQVTDRYGKQNWSIVFSALISPGKIRPATKDKPNTITNSSITVGTFVGARKGIRNFGGVSIGGFGGFSSNEMNKANNTAITGDANENVTTAQYGGGIVFDITNITQVGFLAGFDHSYGELSKTFYYQDKIWFGMSLNFKFLSFSVDEKQN